MGAEVELLGSGIYGSGSGWPNAAVPVCCWRAGRGPYCYAGPQAGRAAALLQEEGLTSLQRAFTCSPLAQVQLHSAEYRVAATRLDCNRCWGWVVL